MSGAGALGDLLLPDGTTLRSDLRELMADEMKMLDAIGINPAHLLGLMVNKGLVPDKPRATRDALLDSPEGGSW